MKNESTRDAYVDDTFTAQQWDETKARHEQQKARNARPITDRIAEIREKMEKKK